VVSRGSRFLDLNKLAIWQKEADVGIVSIVRGEEYAEGGFGRG
jgi:hypothetical protein